MVTPIRPRILVVEPDSSIRALIVAVLRRDGYEAETAETPDEALRLGRTRRHAAVILEPRIREGDTLLDALRSVAHDGKSNVILVTTPDGELPHTVPDGARNVLLKPFRIDDLAAEVSACCDGGTRPA
jgi:DNA-binding response OmpR family regulator